MNSIVERASNKIALRLIPFLILCYFVAYLDCQYGFRSPHCEQSLAIHSSLLLHLAANYQPSALTSIAGMSSAGLSAVW
jgi:hypothetical protein